MPSWLRRYSPERDIASRSPSRAAPGDARKQQERSSSWGRGSGHRRDPPKRLRGEAHPAPFTRVRLPRASPGQAALRVQSKATGHILNSGRPCGTSAGLGPSGRRSSVVPREKWPMIWVEGPPCTRGPALAVRRRGASLCAPPLRRPWGNRGPLPLFPGDHGSGGRKNGSWDTLQVAPGKLQVGMKQGKGAVAAEQVSFKDPALRTLLFSSACTLGLEECHSGFHTDTFLPNQVAAVCC